MGRLSHTPDRQGESNPLRQSQFAMLGEARKPEVVEDELIARCQSMLDAIHLCIHLSRLTHDRINDVLGIDNGHWTRMMQGRAHFPPNKIQPLMELCGNLAPLQYLMALNGLRIPGASALKNAEAA